PVVVGRRGRGEGVAAGGCSAAGNPAGRWAPGPRAGTGADGPGTARGAAAVSWTTAPASGGALAGLVDADAAASHERAVELVDDGLGLFAVDHLDEGEPARLSRFPVGDDLDVRHRSPVLREKCA